MLSREAILSACDASVKTIDVPEWGGAIGIRKLSFAEIKAMREHRDELSEDNASSVSLFLAKTLCNENGERLFSDEDIPQLETRNYDVMIRLANAVNEHNGLTETARQETEKNSESGETGDSTSISPAN